MAQNLFKAIGGWRRAEAKAKIDSDQLADDLRRLARKGFIVRIPGTHRYRLTSKGRRLSMFFAKVYVRIVTPALTHLDPTYLRKSAATLRLLTLGRTSIRL